MSVIDTLLSRNSTKQITGPGPSEEQIQQILSTAMCAPDHGRLRPWRFKRIEGENIGRLADLAVKTLAAEGKPLNPTKEKNMRDWLGRAPLVLAVASYVDYSNERIPQHERIISTGTAVMNILNAAHSLGFGAFWSTGIGTYTQGVPEALGFDELEYQFLGFVVIGSLIAQPEQKERPAVADHVSVWEPNLD
ncbi:MAG TPA: nitroreductase [Alcaligenaceae bacterium]|nr:nitroreductase [Alcaligenaceae bacterium]